MPVLRLTLTGTALAVARLDAGEPVPAWVGDGGGFLSVTRTPRELSVVCAQARVPEGVVVERGWRAFEVQGPLDFGLVGALASIAVPLARAAIGIFVVSTYETDYVLVRAGQVASAATVLREAGHDVPA